MDTVIEIYKYHDYRSYLRDVLKEAKTQAPGFTMRSLAREIGVQPPYLSNVLKGKKSLSEKSQKMIVKVLKLDRDERAYFSLLCLAADSNNGPERMKALQEMQHYQKFRSFHPNESETVRYLSHWYYPAIRELVQLPGFKPDTKWICHALKYTVTHDEIEKALTFLKKQGFVAVDAKGNYFLPSKKVVCDGDVYATALATFHRQLMEKMSEAIDALDKPERYITGHMIPLPKSAFNEVKAALDQCLKRISEISRSKDKPDSIFHVGFFGMAMAEEDVSK